MFRLSQAGHFVKRSVVEIVSQKTWEIVESFIGFIFESKGQRLK